MSANFSFTAVCDEDDTRIDLRNIGKNKKMSTDVTMTQEPQKVSQKVVTMCVNKEVFNDCRDIWEKTGAKLECEAKAKHDFYVKTAKEVGPSKKAQMKMNI